MKADRFFWPPKNHPTPKTPKAKDLYEVGCVANVLQIMRLPDDTVKVLVEGISRARAEFVKRKDEAIFSKITLLNTTDRPDEKAAAAMRRALRSQLVAYTKVNAKIGDELMTKMGEIEDLAKLVDHIISFFPAKLEKRQHLLEMNSLTERANSLLKHITARKRRTKS